MKKTITIEYDPRICPLMDKAIDQAVQSQYDKRIISGKIGSQGKGTADEKWYIDIDLPQGVKDDGGHIFSVKYGPGNVRVMVPLGFSKEDGEFCSVFEEDRPYLYINGRKVVNYEEELYNPLGRNKRKYTVEGLDKPHVIFDYELINNKSYSIAVDHIRFWKAQKGFKGKLY